MHRRVSARKSPEAHVPDVQAGCCIPGCTPEGNVFKYVCTYVMIYILCIYCTLYVCVYIYIYVHTFIIV